MPCGMNLRDIAQQIRNLFDVDIPYSKKQQQKQRPDHFRSAVFILCYMDFKRSYFMLFS